MKMNKILAVILLLLFMVNVAYGQIAISSFGTNPAIVLPGKEVQVTIRLENVGKNDVENILVKLDLSDVPFAPINSASEKVIDEIENDEQAEIVFYLVALPDATSQIYKIPVEVSYEGVSKNSLISLSVIGQTKLDAALDSSEIVKVGDRGKVIVKFVNTGLTEVKFLIITLNQNKGYELFSTDTVYIGKIDVDDFETAEFDIFAKERNPQLVMNVNYRDSSNKEYNQVKIIALNVYSQEEAKQLGLASNNYAIWIILPIAILIVVFFIYRRIGRRKLR